MPETANITLRRIICKRCGSLTYRRTSRAEYFQYCPTCDEDMYSFEVVTVINEEMNHA